MNFIANESEQKLRGGFYTDSDIASFLARWVLKKRPKSILEPSCGDGALIDAILQERHAFVERIVGCEIDHAEAAKARERASAADCDRVEIRAGDFLKWFLFHAVGREHFDAVIGNPPFIRYQYLSEEMQALAEKVFERFGLPFTKHTNAWVPFVIASLAMLTPGGRLAMVIPSEIFHIPHAQSLRRYLATHCSRVFIFDPEELWFDDALQGVVLMLAEKKEDASERSEGVAVKSDADREVLSADAEKFFADGDYINGPSIEGKWMPVFLNRRERSLLASMRRQHGVAPFIEMADVDVGIVTGANKFFLVSDAVVREHGLERWAHPMFGRSEHVSGVIYAAADHRANRDAGLPTNFLWFDAEDIGAFPASVQRYIRTGEADKLHTRFKCRVRSPWFKVPSVHTAPIAMLKRAHHYPRLVLNRAGAFTTDTAYRIRPKVSDAGGLVHSFVNSLTCLTAELEGRHYGGGVLELVPSEIERLLLPVRKTGAGDLRALDELIRTGAEAEDVLQTQDRTVLRGIGLARADCAMLHGAWDRLRKRRQRDSGEAED